MLEIPPSVLLLKDIATLASLIWFISWKLSTVTSKQTATTDSLDLVRTDMKEIKNDMKEKLHESREAILREINLRLDQSRELSTANAQNQTEAHQATARKLTEACGEIAKISKDLESVKHDTAKVTHISEELSGIKSKLDLVERDVENLKKSVSAKARTKPPKTSKAA